MGIELYEHNLAAYNAAVLMLGNAGKAAIIHPTGTGKSFIGFKLCEENPDKTVCWLSPSDYIFKTQMENLKQATAIRYLDNQRDMADELFSGNIASEMTLGEAIIRGILNPPTYIVLMYSYQ